MASLGIRFPALGVSGRSLALGRKDPERSWPRTERRMATSHCCFTRTSEPLRRPFIGLSARRFAARRNLGCLRVTTTTTKTTTTPPIFDGTRRKAIATTESETGNGRNDQEGSRPLRQATETGLHFVQEGRQWVSSARYSPCPKRGAAHWASSNPPALS